MFLGGWWSNQLPTDVSLWWYVTIPCIANHFIQHVARHNLVNGNSYFSYQIKQQIMRTGFFDENNPITIWSKDIIITLVMAYLIRTTITQHFTLLVVVEPITLSLPIKVSLGCVLSIPCIQATIRAMR